MIIHPTAATFFVIDPLGTFLKHFVQFVHGAFSQPRANFDALANICHKFQRIKIGQTMILNKTMNAKLE
jgi:nitrate/TMAO reductase-like tetraheme cytochrome c subunit